jgi:SAM-dependent methyltransferase
MKVAISSTCALCGGATAHALTAWDRNREVDREPFAYRRCEACGTVQLADVPGDLGRYYPRDYHGVPAAEELRERAELEAHKVELLTAHVAPGRLVEVGPSFGAFALAAKEAGFDVTGIEMDARCCDYLHETVGVQAINSAEPEEVLPTLPRSRVITMWHVLEHLPRPVTVLERAAENLEPGGVLAVAVPNPESVQFRVLRARWAHLDAPRHLFLIPLETLLDHARAFGLEPVAVATDDPFGRHCNRFGWEYALRRRPSTGPSGPLVRRASQVMEKGLAPVERRGHNGAAYTVLLRR